jgi:outer membrane protein assembly factor BamB
MYKHNRNDLSIIKEIDPPGDSLFTDLTINKEKQIIYVHRMHNTSAGGGVILVLDTNGNLLKQYNSPATDYPIGLELVDGKLVVSDRDRRRIYEMNPETGEVISNRLNPSQARYGPRGIAYDGNEFLFEVITEFPTDAGLTDAYLIKFSKNNLTEEIDRIQLTDRNGLINGRGVEYDPADKNLWITSFGGDIYKIAGFDTQINSYDENWQKSLELNNILSATIYPNPMQDFSNVSFALKNAANIKIELFDVFGTRLAELFDGFVDEGSRNVIQLEGKKLNPGVYYIVFNINGQRVVAEKLPLVR